MNAPPTTHVRRRRPPPGFLWATAGTLPFHLIRIPASGELPADGEPVDVLCGHPLPAREHLPFPPGRMIPNFVSTDCAEPVACPRCVELADRRP